MIADTPPCPKGDHVARTRKHIDRLGNMAASADQIMRAHESNMAANGVVTIPSGPFWQQT